jgi:hypothetical protein
MAINKTYLLPSPTTHSSNPNAQQESTWRQRKTHDLQESTGKQADTGYQ